MDDDALVIETTSGKYTMLLNAQNNKSRHRFSTAHEIAHLLISPLIGHKTVHRQRFSKNQDPDGRRIEALCNDMASAILMPRPLVDDIVNQSTPSAACIASLIDDFGVSFEAAARRYVTVLSLPCILVKWQFRSGARKEEKPVTNFGLRNGWLKFYRNDSSFWHKSTERSSLVRSKDHVVVYLGPHSDVAPVHIEDAVVETVDHGRGRYRRMYSFVYVPAHLAQLFKF